MSVTQCGAYPKAGTAVWSRVRKTKLDTHKFMKRINWQTWAGFILSLVAGFSYPLVFVQWPITREFPWANLLLFAIAIVLLFLGHREFFCDSAAGTGSRCRKGAAVKWRRRNYD